MKKDILRNLTKLTGKHLCQGLFLNKETLAKMLSCEFCEISKNTFFIEHVRMTTSVRYVYIYIYIYINTSIYIYIYLYIYISIYIYIYICESNWCEDKYSNHILLTEPFLESLTSGGGGEEIIKWLK